ncbi:unnamed protein product [Prorocentrum cordatum]|uniref:EXS domain-containing protein n=1 Tax=Prorocentrum cordatum TaxID=2364126 RepID=A0ABN9T774_9DINO|nr:unnamed protein product [Polarella glacialis]
MCELNLQGFQKLIKKRKKALKREKRSGRSRGSTASSLVDPLLPEARYLSPLLARDIPPVPEDSTGGPTGAQPNLGHASEAYRLQVSSDEEGQAAWGVPQGAGLVDISYVRQQPFWAVHCSEAQGLARRIEEAFATHVTGGEVGRAQMKLRVFQREAMSQAALMEVGVCSGVAATLTFTIGILLGYPSENQCPACVDVLHGMVPVFRLTFVPILWLICWSCLCYLWRLHDINYLYILEIDAHTELGVWRALKLGTKLLAFWLLAVFLFLYGTQTGVPPLLGIDSRYYPLGFTILCVVMAVSPRGMFYFKTRKWLAVSLLRVVQAPTREVKLRENLVADVLTSMVKEAVDMYYTWMLFSTGDFQHDKLRHFPDQFSRIGPMLIIIAPYWCRLFQCLRRYWDSCVASRVSGSPGGCWPSIGLLGMGDCLHLINAGKYFSSICAISLSALGGFRHIVGPYVIWSSFRKIWLALLVISAVYAYAWDIIQDMGLVKLRRSQKTGRLQLCRRKTGAFSSRGLLLWLALSNFVGRMAWAVTIVPRGRFSMEAVGIPGCFMDSLVTLAEVLRRAQWTLLRVEHEHAENPNNYRSIVEVPSAILQREDGEEETHTGGEASAAISIVVVLAMFLVLSVLLYYRRIRACGCQATAGRLAPRYGTGIELAPAPRPRRRAVRMQRKREEGDQVRDAAPVGHRSR